MTANAVMDTGGNRGPGLEIAEQLTEQGTAVLVAARTLEAAAAASG